MSVFNEDDFNEFYTSDDGERITEPTYQLTGFCFLDNASYEDGEVVTTSITPNYQMQPLNRRAAIARNEWEDSLPANMTGVSMEDLMQASIMLRPKEGDKELNHDDWSAQVRLLAIKLREKANNGKRLHLDDPRVHRTNRSTVAPIMNAEIVDEDRTRGSNLVTVKPQRRESVVARANRKRDMTNVGKRQSERMVDA